ncbi:unnamed protein product [Cyprideis torosa]|uniref:Uncharacterized protein n=1 Tax=Cyprideis torosa TaxID=163714 RepID=A0A7R8WVX0_9CRUS|nr:unnamed protein product [Cyprideis torosa]CAG0907551.1 unnamed protein product [Cyprideis torosa]
MPELRELLGVSLRYLDPTKLGDTLVEGFDIQAQEECTDILCFSSGREVLRHIQATGVGCQNLSEDIIRHRKLMGIGLTEDDLKGTTCPYVFAKPCSPHLAASLEGKTIDPDIIIEATDILRKKYDFVVLEGVGGLMVPLRDDLFLVDYLKRVMTEDTRECIQRYLRQKGLAEDCVDMQRQKGNDIILPDFSALLDALQ